MYKQCLLQFGRAIMYCLLLPVLSTGQAVFRDTLFEQEYHEHYSTGSNAKQQEARSIAVDKEGNVWIATAAGVLVKNTGAKTWRSPVANFEMGPAYAVAADAAGTIWIGTWDGIYSFRNKSLGKIKGTDGPVAVLCVAKEGVYAGGPKGIWLCNGNSAEKKEFSVARSLRKMISDNNNGVWIASDVGLYHCTPKSTTHFVDTAFLLSAYVKGLALGDDQQLWAGGLGGVSVLRDEARVRTLTPQSGCPSQYINCIGKDATGTMWVGTDVGVVRFLKDGGHSLLFSRRWLADDRVRDIAFDDDGTAWIATANGVSAIRKRKMDLSSKQDFFYDVLMKRHIRAPWIAGQCHLKIAGDVDSWEPEDDDNDGEYTGNYLAMESFRYAATKNKDAQAKAKKAFAFLKMQEEITGGDGYFARTIVPVDWLNKVHDGNTTYTAQDLAEEMVREPRFKPVELRWRKSADGKWLWKGDASSDEWCGHMLGYFFYYELAAEGPEKLSVQNHVRKLIDHLIKHDFNMVDVDGTHTRWSVWSPALLNHDPEWLPDQRQNSMELLAFLKLAYYMTTDQKYQDQYLRLIKEEHYLDNMAKVTQQNPAWFIYFDVSLQAYLYPILLHCEKDPALLAFYKQHLEDWMERRRKDKCPLINFLYAYATKKPAGIKESIDFLTDTPLDLVDWFIDHTKRADVRVVNEPVLDEVQVNELPPASIRQTVRWDKNPWTAVGGNPQTEREPVFWLLPYWMGRYLKMIE